MVRVYCSTVCTHHRGTRAQRSSFWGGHRRRGRSKGAFPIVPVKGFCFLSKTLKSDLKIDKIMTNVLNVLSTFSSKAYFLNFMFFIKKKGNQRAVTQMVLPHAYISARGIRWSPRNRHVAAALVLRDSHARCSSAPGYSSLYRSFKAKPVVSGRCFLVLEFSSDLIML